MGRPSFPDLRAGCPSMSSFEFIFDGMVGTTSEIDQIHLRGEGLRISDCMVGLEVFPGETQSDSHIVFFASCGNVATNELSYNHRHFGFSIG